MNNKAFSSLAIIGIVVAALIVIGGISYFAVHKNIPAQNSNANNIACTLEAKECPDGSYVGRTGPNCEFSACPAAAISTSTEPPVQTSTTQTIPGTVKGTLLLSPICPVQKNPPDPKCAPKPYKTSIVISNILNASSVFKIIQSNASGTFTVSLPVGKYIFKPQGGSPYPRCEQQTANVTAGNTDSFDFHCDTGIR